MALVFDDVFGHRLVLEAARRAHIVTDHPEVRPYVSRLAEVFGSPEWVKRSRRDRSVYLYYRFYPDMLGGKYLLAVARIGVHPEVLTCYITDAIKHGELLWPKP